MRNLIPITALIIVLMALFAPLATAQGPAADSATPTVIVQAPEPADTNWVQVGIAALVVVAFGFGFHFLMKMSGENTILGKLMESGVKLAPAAASFLDRLDVLEPQTRDQVSVLTQRYVEKHDALLRDARDPSSPGGLTITEAERSRITQGAYDFAMANLQGDFRQVAEHLQEEWVKGIAGVVIAGLGIIKGRVIENDESRPVEAAAGVTS